MSADAPVLIAGAGIAGLSAAIALAAKSFRVICVERRSEMSEAGAGIQIGPNGMRVLTDLGVTPFLEPHVGRPLSLMIHRGDTGSLITELPLGDEIATRHGAPYWVAHRADLQRALLARAANEPRIEITTGADLAGFEQDGQVVRAHFADRASVSGEALIGADGIWSVVRQQLIPDAAPAYAGKMAIRTVIATRQVPQFFQQPKTGVWLGRDAHVVHYPVRGNEAIAIVVIVDEPNQKDGWNNEIDRALVLRRLQAFASPLRDLIATGQDWRVWSLYDPPPLPRWSKGRVALIGDAAHPILPFLAQGAVMALEDAQTLAQAMAALPDDPGRAFVAMAQARRGRVARVQLAARNNGRIYHMAGPMGLARDTVLRLTPPSRVMAALDWLYGWRGDRLDQ